MSNNPCNITKDGWSWEINTQTPASGVPLYDLKDSSDRLLAWVEARNSYCDRGHWKGQIDVPCGLDGQDGWPNYYMSLERAKMEIYDFLRWRLFKIRWSP